MLHETESLSRLEESMVVSPLVSISLPAGGFELHVRPPANGLTHSNRADAVVGDIVTGSGKLDVVPARFAYLMAPPPSCFDDDYSKIEIEEVEEEGGEDALTLPPMMEVHSAVVSLTAVLPMPSSTLTVDGCAGSNKPIENGGARNLPVWGNCNGGTTAPIAAAISISSPSNGSSSVGGGHDGNSDSATAASPSPQQKASTPSVCGGGAGINSNSSRKRDTSSSRRFNRRLPTLLPRRSANNRNSNSAANNVTSSSSSSIINSSAFGVADDFIDSHQHLLCVVDSPSTVSLKSSMIVDEDLGGSSNSSGMDGTIVLGSSASSSLPPYPSPTFIKTHNTGTVTTGTVATTTATAATVATAATATGPTSTSFEQHHHSKSSDPVVLSMLPSSSIMNHGCGSSRNSTSSNSGGLGGISSTTTTPTSCGSTTTTTTSSGCSRGGGSSKQHKNSCSACNNNSAAIAVAVMGSSSSSNHNTNSISGVAADQLQLNNLCFPSVFLPSHLHYNQKTLMFENNIPDITVEGPSSSEMMLDGGSFVSSIVGSKSAVVQQSPGINSHGSSNHHLQQHSEFSPIALNPFSSPFQDLRATPPYSHLSNPDAFIGGSSNADSFNGGCLSSTSLMQFPPLEPSFEVDALLYYDDCQASQPVGQHNQQLNHQQTSSTTPCIMNISSMPSRQTLGPISNNDSGSNGGGSSTSMLMMISSSGNIGHNLNFNNLNNAGTILSNNRKATTIDKTRLTDEEVEQIQSARRERKRLRDRERRRVKRKEEQDRKKVEEEVVGNDEANPMFSLHQELQYLGDDGGTNLDHRLTESSFITWGGLSSSAGSLGGRGSDPMLRQGSISESEKGDLDEDDDEFDDDLDDLTSSTILNNINTVGTAGGGGWLAPHIDMKNRTGTSRTNVENLLPSYAAAAATSTYYRRQQQSSGGNSTTSRRRPAKSRRRNYSSSSPATGNASSIVSEDDVYVCGGVSSSASRKKKPQSPQSDKASPTKSCSSAATTQASSPVRSSSANVVATRNSNGSPSSSTSSPSLTTKSGGSVGVGDTAGDHVTPTTHYSRTGGNLRGSSNNIASEKQLPPNVSISGGGINSIDDIKDSLSSNNQYNGRNFEVIRKLQQRYENFQTDDTVLRFLEKPRVRYTAGSSSSSSNNNKNKRGGIFMGNTTFISAASSDDYGNDNEEFPPHGEPHGEMHHVDEVKDRDIEILRAMISADDLNDEDVANVANHHQAGQQQVLESMEEDDMTAAAKLISNCMGQDIMSDMDDDEDDQDRVTGEQTPYAGNSNGGLPAVRLSVSVS